MQMQVTFDLGCSEKNEMSYCLLTGNLSEKL